MTTIRSLRAVGSRPVLHLLLAAALVVAAAPGRAANDLDNGGTFNAPGYPQRGATSNGQLAPGANNPAGARNPAAPNAPPIYPANGPNGRNPALGNELPARRSEPPPPKPSEFQRFVEGATGRLLPIFGSTFFAEAADTYQPLDNVPVSADYTIGPGDEIVTRAWGSIDVDYRSTVDRNGMLNLPKIGSFNVAGVKAADLERNLRAQIGRLYTNFDLSVSLGQLRGLRVFVVGPAQRPGVLTLPSQSTLLSAVVAAGGPAPNGSMRSVLLRRDGKVISDLDVYSFLVQGDKSKDMQLAAGDVVVFRPAGPQVALTGSIDTPAIYELNSAQEPLREVLRYAGGAPVLANPNRVQLERIDPAQTPAARFVETFRLDDSGLRKELRDGDVVTLLEISPQFANAVTLRGHVAQPLRYPVHAGHADPRSHSGSRGADLARFLSPQEPARADDRRGRDRGGAERVARRRHDAAAGRPERTGRRHRRLGHGRRARDQRGQCGARREPALPELPELPAVRPVQSLRSLRGAAAASRRDRPTNDQSQRRRARAAQRGPRRRPALAAPAGRALRRPELGLRDDRAPQPRPVDAGHRLQPRQGRAAG